MAVVSGGFGMDEDSVDFGAEKFEAVFKRGDDVVDLLHGQFVGQGAVAGDLQVVSEATDGDVVDVEDGWQLGGGGA